MPEKAKEIRFLQTQHIEVRAKKSDDDTSMGVTGYVVKWDQRSQLIWGEFYEKVARGAFSQSLEENTIKALWNHRSDFVLGSTKSRTLRLEEDETGLRFEIDLPDSTWGRDAYASIQRGDVDGVSFGFTVCSNGDRWQYIKEEDLYERTLLNVNLFEISPTPFPAYPDSEVNQRSIETFGITTKEQRRLEKEKLLLDIELLGL